MRTAVTLAKKHTGDWVMLAHPDVLLVDQNKIYRSFLLEKVHPDYCYVQLQESDGLFRRTYLRTPDAHKEHAAIQEKQNAEAAEAGKRELDLQEQRRKGLIDERYEQHKAEIDRLNKLAEDQGSKEAAKPDKGAETPSTPAAPGDLKPGGPTLEDWAEQGYSLLSYPPEGFAEVNTPGLQEYKTTGKLTPRVAPAAPTVAEAPATVVSSEPGQAAPAVESQPEAAPAPQASETPSTPAAKPEGETKKGRGSK